MTSWILSDIQALVNAHYGMEMPITVVSRDEYAVSQPCVGSFESAMERLLWDWDIRTEPCLDLVVWDATSESLQLVQAVCFMDAYPTHASWLCAVRTLLSRSASVWVVTH